MFILKKLNFKTIIILLIVEILYTHFVTSSRHVLNFVESMMVV